MPVPRDFADPAVRRGWIETLLAPLDEARWEELARELFTWQFTRLPALRRLGEGYGITPRTLRSWREIPAMPQQMFKLEKLFAHGDVVPAAIYETSGTTTGEPGRQHLLRPDVYRAVAVEGARRSGFLEGEMALHFLVAAPAAVPRSSLSAMFGFWRNSGTRNGTFWLAKNRFDFDKLRLALAREARPVALCGTAFAFVHLLEAWSRPIRLPRGSRLLETGGFKGRTREVPKPKLYAHLAKMFGLSDGTIWNEYGMSELSSQAYARGTEGLHATPPWARVLVVDPATGREVRPGRRGLVRWFDLANVDSVLALQTLDRAERHADGFRLIGRLPRTEPRGCSLGVEDLVGAAP